MSLRNEDYTDRELLAVINRLASPATSDDVADALQMSRRDVSMRLSWMRRYGYLDAIAGKRPPVSWVLSDAGRELVNGKLSQQATRSFDAMNAGARLLAMRHLMEQGYIDAGAPFANALRREYLHQQARRSR